MPPTFPFYTWSSHPEHSPTQQLFFMLLSLFHAAASPLDISQCSYFTGFLYLTLSLTPNVNRVWSFLSKINTLSPKISTCLPKHHQWSVTERYITVHQIQIRFLTLLKCSTGSEMIFKQQVHLILAWPPCSTPSQPWHYISPPFPSLSLTLFIFLLLLLLVSLIIITAILNFFYTASTIIYLPGINKDFTNANTHTCAYEPPHPSLLLLWFFYRVKKLLAF